MKEYKVSKQESNQRIDKFIKKYLPNAPLSLIYKVFRKKDVKVNGKRINNIKYIINENDIIQIYMPENPEFEENTNILELPITFDVVYEDEHLLVCNKPVGLLVVEDVNEKINTLANQVITYLYKKGEYDPSNQKGFTPAPVHRIDRNTSGIVLVGKDLQTIQELSLLFKNHDELEKEYLALVFGYVKQKGIINSQLIKDEKTSLVRLAKSNEKGLTALTRYEPLKLYKDTTLVSVKIETGRTHQIRVHMASIGYPLVGDAKYGDFNSNKLIKQKYGWQFQFLHAHRLKLNGLNGELSYLNNKIFEAPLPKENKKLLEKLREKNSNI